MFFVMLGSNFFPRSLDVNLTDILSNQSLNHCYLLVDTYETLNCSMVLKTRADRIFGIFISSWTRLVKLSLYSFSFIQPNIFSIGLRSGLWLYHSLLFFLIFLSIPYLALWCVPRVIILNEKPLITMKNLSLFNQVPLQYINEK